MRCKIGVRNMIIKNRNLKCLFYMTNIGCICPLFVAVLYTSCPKTYSLSIRKWQADRAIIL